MWGVPIDHEYFSNTNMIQWMWYYYQDMKDHEESYLKNRNMLEYHASFIEPELVAKVMEKREQTKESGVIGTKDSAAFNDSLKGIFGRDAGLAPASESNDAQVHNVSDVMERMAAYEEEQNLLKKMPIYNYKHWTDFNLG